MNTIISNTNLIAITNGEPTTTSLALADGTGTEHRAVIQLIRNYLEDLKEFGNIAFEMRNTDFKGEKRSGRPTEFALLNEPQATLIMTYMKNTEIVREFKKTLVKAFFEARKQLQKQFDPAKLSRGDILRIALDAEEENQKLEAKIENDKPLVEFAEKHANADGWFCLGDAAKQIGYPPRKFNQWLNMKGYTFRRGGKHWMPYSEAQKRGFLDVKSVTIEVHGEDKVSQQCMVTAKGIQHFTARLRKEGLVV